MDDERPLFVQIADAIEDQIISGALLEGSVAPSTNALAGFYRVNPATAAKGMHLLQQEGILERRRGLGMFVCGGARNKLLGKRRAAFNKMFVKPLVREAGALGLSGAELLEMVDSALGESAGNSEEDALTRNAPTGAFLERETL